MPNVSLLWAVFYLAAFAHAQTFNEETSIADSCRHLTEAEWSKQDDSFPEILDEMNYNCGDSATSKETDPYTLQSNLLYNLLEPAVISSGQCPDRSKGTNADLKALLRELYPVMVMNVATNNVLGGKIDRFLKLTQGYTYPAVGGGVINSVEYVENQQMPSVQEYISSIPSLLAGDATLPKPIGADTKVFVVDFKAPAPKTQAAFFFFATELLNPCMWSTDSDFLQSEYKPGNDKLTAPCYGCMAHRGFLRAFHSITNTSDPKYDIAAAWTTKTGVAVEEVTSVLCSGFSLGAALATLCGPWAQATFPNAKVQVVTAGSPRVFNPAAASWYDANVEYNYRLVNNKDIVPSLPLQTWGLLKYKHVGMPIFLDRRGENLPGEYVAFRGERPEWYTGSLTDHVMGYILGMKQAMTCTMHASV
nr:putative extracellular protein CSOL_025 [Pseudococcomyxa simplex]